ncbi:MAG: hypothetical protein JW751_10200 [Polyangiaceae bacterium]|nr:hypothetical protein [Polyangiaceae bacterium]
MNLARTPDSSPSPSGSTVKRRRSLVYALLPLSGCALVVAIGGAAAVVGVLLLRSGTVPERFLPRPLRDLMGNPGATRGTGDHADADRRAARVCSLDSWCVTGAALPAVSLYGTDGSSAEDVWAVGGTGLVLHWNGRDWGGWIGLGDAAAFWTVRAFGPRDVWVAGQSGSVMHWDGSEWSRESLGPSVSRWPRVKALAGPSSDVLWAALDGGTLLRREGPGRWGTAPSPWSEASSRPWVMEVAGPREAWAGTTGGRIAQWNGERWAELSANPSAAHQEITAIRRLGDGTVAFVSEGPPGAWVLRDGMLHELPRPPGEGLLAVGGTAERDLWVAGRKGILLHWDGTTWQRPGAPLANEWRELRGLVVTGPGQGVAAGELGVRLHFGAHPVAYRLEAPPAFNDVAATPSGAPVVFQKEAWGVGADGLFARWDGDTWQRVATGTKDAFVAVSVSSQGSVDAATFRNLTLHVEGNDRMTAVARPTPWTSGVVALVHDASQRAWAASYHGGVARWEPSGWQVLREETASTSVSDLALDAQGNAWLVGQRFPDENSAPVPLLMRWSQGRWTELPVRTSDVEACHAPSANLVLARSGELIASAGTREQPCLLRLVGSGWQPIDRVAATPALLEPPPGRLPFDDLAIARGTGAFGPEPAELWARSGERWRVLALPAAGPHRVAQSADRAWVIGSGSLRRLLLDFAPGESWRRAIPTLVPTAARRGESPSAERPEVHPVPPGRAAPVSPIAPPRAAAPATAPTSEPPSAETEHGPTWEAAMGRGRLATVRKDYPAAIRAFDEALDAEPGDAQALAERGYAKYLAGDLEGATRDFDQAESRSRDNSLLRAIRHNRELIAAARAGR